MTFFKIYVIFEISKVIQLTWMKKLMVGAIALWTKMMIIVLLF